MSIPVKCPNGHSLKIKESYAGKTGLCPICKARIKVPIPQPRETSDDVLMDILKPSESGLSGIALNISDLGDGRDNSADSGYSWTKSPTPTVKICPKCHTQIPYEATVCPNCRTWVARL